MAEYIDVYKKDGRWYFVHRGYTRITPETVKDFSGACAYIQANYKGSAKLRLFEGMILR